MPSITIRNVPEDTHRELASRAALAGQSLQEYLREMLVQTAEKPDIKTLMAQVRALKEREPTHLTVEKILEYRDMDRR